MSVLKEQKNVIEEKIPAHVAIIMDGNGRWAKKRGLPRSAGHVKGAAAFKNITFYSRDRGIKYLTVYAFSTENWKRDEQEISGIMNLLREYLKDVKNYTKENIRIKFLGDRTPLAPDIIALMNETEEISKDYNAMTLNIAINYGGLPEIANAARICAEMIEKGQLSANDISVDEIKKHLYTESQPDPDLIIRTGGEYRLSNFLTFQSAYSELYFCDVLWPDFGKKDLDAAIAEFSRRNRRYGSA